MFNINKKKIGQKNIVVLLLQTNGHYFQNGHHFKNGFYKQSWVSIFKFNSNINHLFII